MLGKNQSVLRDLAHIVVSVEVLHRQGNGQATLSLLEDRIEEFHELEVPFDWVRPVLDVIFEFVAITFRVQSEESFEELSYVVCGAAGYRVVRLRIWQFDSCCRRFSRNRGVLGDHHIAVAILHDVDGVGAGHGLLGFALGEILRHRE